LKFVNRPAATLSIGCSGAFLRSPFGSVHFAFLAGNQRIAVPCLSAELPKMKSDACGTASANWESRKSTHPEFEAR
jgi:hypothetical protein